MAKSARASNLKKNKAALKKRVFGPVETKRNDRLSAKLMELAQAPKPSREQMEAEPTEALEQEKANAQLEMDLEADVTATETQKPLRSNREMRRIRDARAARIEKKRHRKPQNRTTFPAHPKKAKSSKR